MEGWFAKSRWPPSNPLPSNRGRLCKIDVDLPTMASRRRLSELPHNRRESLKASAAQLKWGCFGGSSWEWAKCIESH